MDLKTYLKSLPDDAAREAFAKRCNTSLGHLKNVMYGYKPCATGLAVSIERESARAVTRPELRRDWERHWPELAPAARSLSQDQVDIAVAAAKKVIAQSEARLSSRRDGPTNKREKR